MITKKQLESKRQQVRNVFSKYGFNSEQYNQAFEELHDLNIKYMEQQYRAERGWSQNRLTPYSDRSNVLELK